MVLTVMFDPELGSGDRSAGVSRRRFVQATGAAGISVGLAGCTGGSDDGTVVVSADEEVREAEDEIIAALREAGLDTDIEVDIQAEDFETDSRRQTYSSGLDAGRSSPDLMMMDSGWTIPFILREQIQNLEEVLSSDIRSRIDSQYLEASVETAQDPETGDLFGVPIFPDYPVMQYRKDLVEDAGYNPESDNWSTEPMSWMEFSEVVADVHSQNDDVEYGFTTQAAAYEGLACCTFNETMSSFGGAYFGGLDNLYGPVGDRPVTVDEEPVVEAIRMMRAFMHDDDDEAADGYEQIAPTSIVQWTEEDARAPFTAGNAVAHRNWPYSVVINGAEDEMGDDLGTMPIPYGIPESESEYDGLGGSCAALGGWHLTINPNTANMENTVQVLEAWTSDEVMLAIFEHVGNLPPIPELMDDVTEDDVGPIGRYVDTLEVAAENAIPRPVTDIWPSQSSQVYQEVHDAYTQEKDPQEAMDDLAEALESSESR